MSVLGKTTLGVVGIQREGPTAGRMEAPRTGLICLAQQAPEGLQPAAQGTPLGRHWPR